MFGKREQGRVDPATLENMVWLCDKGDSKRHPGQWMRDEWHEIWLQSVYNGFRLLGMTESYEQFTEELVTFQISEVQDGFVPVQGWKSRHSVRTALENLPEAFPEFRLIAVFNGQALVYEGKWREALHVWHGVTELLTKTMITTIVTDALSHYVVGTQVGYSTACRHLFKRGNTVKRIGTPLEPMWELNISDYRVVLGCPWDKVADTQREIGYSILQQMQLALNDALEQTLRRER